MGMLFWKTFKNFITLRALEKSFNNYKIIALGCPKNNVSKKWIKDFIEFKHGLFSSLIKIKIYSNNQ